MKTRVHVVGAGGIGVVLAWSLARAGWEDTLVERRPDKIAAGRGEGIVVAGQTPDAASHLGASCQPGWSLTGSCNNPGIRALYRHKPPRP